VVTFRLAADGHNGTAGPERQAAGVSRAAQLDEACAGAALVLTGEQRRRLDAPA
jgi:hypothetical protein